MLVTKWPENIVSKQHYQCKASASFLQYIGHVYGFYIKKSQTRQCVEGTLYSSYLLNSLSLPMNLRPRRYQYNHQYRKSRLLSLRGKDATAPLLVTKTNQTRFATYVKNLRVDIFVSKNISWS